jgi:acetyltransferase-like isoleucine patch superfamily enzyme
MIRPPISYRFRIAWSRLWTRVVLGRRFAHVGDRAWIGRPLLLLGHENISIGDNSSIRAGARLEAQPRFDHRVPRLSIGSHTNIEQNVHIMCQSRVTIGDRVSITGHCAIVDVTHPIDVAGVKIGDAIVDEDSYVEIHDDVFIGFGAVVLPNVTIGRGAVIGANSVVSSDIPPYSVAGGVPARVLRLRRMAP